MGKSFEDCLFMWIVILILVGLMWIFIRLCFMTSGLFLIVPFIVIAPPYIFSLRNRK